MSLYPTHSANKAPMVVVDQDLFLLELLLDANRLNNGWQNFLDAFRRHFNLHSCHIYLSSGSELAPRFQDSSGPRPSDWQLKEYMEKYSHNDDTHLAILNGQPGTWFASNLIPNREIIESAPVFSQCFIPNGIHYVAGTCLFRDERSTCVFVHNRGQQHGRYGIGEIERCAALTPFLIHAIQLRLKLAEDIHDRLRIRSVLNKFRLPVAMLNEFGETMVQNSLMEQLVKKHQSIRLEHGKHRMLSHQEQDKQFKMAIAERIANAKGQSSSDDTYSLLIPAEEDIPEYRLAVEPMLEIASDEQQKFAGAMVYAISADMLIAPSPAQLAKLFNLSPAESECCHLFARGKSLKEIAELKCKSVNTVREQLQNSYRKTNTKNQLELINLLASLPAG